MNQRTDVTDWSSETTTCINFKKSKKRKPRVDCNIKTPGSNPDTRDSLRSINSQLRKTLVSECHCLLYGPEILNNKLEDKNDSCSLKKSEERKETRSRVPRFQANYGSMIFRLQPQLVIPTSGNHNSLPHLLIHHEGLYLLCALRAGNTIHPQNSGWLYPSASQSQVSSPTTPSSSRHLIITQGMAI